MNVLIVEVDPGVRSAIDRALRGATHQTELAPNGERALELAARSAFDAMVLDLGLPGIDGIEVCRRLRGDLKTAFIPVIMMTANREQETQAKAWQAGTDDYLSKPVDPLDLQRRIERLLARTYGI